MKNNNCPSLKKNFFLSTIYELLCVLTPFITAPYISRVLGAEGVGIFSFTTANQMYFSMFAALGTYSYGAREISRNRDSIQERSKLFWEIEILTIITSFISLIAWGIFILLNKQYQIYYIILTGCLFETMFNISWFFKGIEQFKYTVTKNTIVKLIGIILLFIFVKNENDLIIYFIIHVFINLIGTLSMWGALSKFICKVNYKQFKIKRHFSETLIYFIPSVANSVYTILDKTLIGVITKEPVQNGYYEQAHKIINIIKTFTATSLNSVMGVRIAYLFKENKYKEIKLKINDSINYILFMGIGCCFGLIGIAKRFVPVFFGPGFDSVVYLLWILSPLILVISLSNCLGAQYYNPVGLRKFSAKLLIIGSIINLFLNLILIPIYKSYGAAFGSLIAELIICILYMKYCKDFFSFKLFFKLLYKKIIAGLGMLCLIVLFDRLITNNILCLLLQICLGGVFYITILIFMKDSFIFEFIYPRLKIKLNKVKSHEK